MIFQRQPWFLIVQWFLLEVDLVGLVFLPDDWRLGCVILWLLFAVLITKPLYLRLLADVGAAVHWEETVFGACKFGGVVTGWGLFGPGGLLEDSRALGVHPGLWDLIWVVFSWSWRLVLQRLQWTDIHLVWIRPWIWEQPSMHTYDLIDLILNLILVVSARNRRKLILHLEKLLLEEVHVGAVIMWLLVKIVVIMWFWSFEILKCPCSYRFLLRHIYRSWHEWSCFVLENSTTWDRRRTFLPEAFDRWFALLLRNWLFIFNFLLILLILTEITQKMYSIAVHSYFVSNFSFSRLCLILQKKGVTVFCCFGVFHYRNGFVQCHDGCAWFLGYTGWLRWFVLLWGSSVSNTTEDASTSLWLWLWRTWASQSTYRMLPFNNLLWKLGRHPRIYRRLSTTCLWSQNLYLFCRPGCYSHWLRPKKLRLLTNWRQLAPRSYLLDASRLPIVVVVTCEAYSCEVGIAVSAVGRHELSDLDGARLTLWWEWIGLFLQFGLISFVLSFVF